MIVLLLLLLLVDNRMECHNRYFLRHVFGIKGQKMDGSQKQNMTTSLSPLKLESRDPQISLETSWLPLSCLTVSHNLHLYVFSDCHHRQCPKLLCSLSQTSPSPQPPNPVHIILQSTCSLGLLIFYFPFSTPPISLSSSSLHLLKHIFYSSVCLSEVLLNSHFSSFSL